MILKEVQFTSIVDISLSNKSWTQFAPIILRHLSKILKYLPPMTSCNTFWMKLNVKKNQGCKTQNWNSGIILSQWLSTNLQTIVRPSTMHDAHENFSPLYCTRVVKGPRSAIPWFCRKCIRRYAWPDLTLAGIRDRTRILCLQERKGTARRSPCNWYKFLWKRFWIYNKRMIPHHLQ